MLAAKTLCNLLRDDGETNVTPPLSAGAAYALQALVDGDRVKSDCAAWPDTEARAAWPQLARGLHALLGGFLSAMPADEHADELVELPERPLVVQCASVGV